MQMKTPLTHCHCFTANNQTEKNISDYTKKTTTEKRFATMLGSQSPPTQPTPHHNTNGMIH